MKSSTLRNGGIGRSLFTPILGFPCSSNSKEFACNAGDLGSIPGSGRSSGEGNGNPLQYSCLENPMDRGAWRATIHGVAKSQTMQQQTISKTDMLLYKNIMAFKHNFLFLTQLLIDNSYFFSVRAVCHP